MILTENPIFIHASKNRKGTWNRSDDVRRSIDVLDQVLSEFDDIEDNLPLPSPGIDGEEGVDEEGDEEENLGDVPPPPVDRSLKPRISPPTLPQKKKGGRGSSSLGRDGGGESPENHPRGRVVQLQPVQNGHHGHNASQRSKLSEASSHEYQEINSDFCSRGPHFSDARGRTRHLSHRDSGPPPADAPLRKSKSQDISLASEDARARRSGRRHAHQRRGRSSERVLDRGPASPQPQWDPRCLLLPELGSFIDPRLVPPFDPGSLCDPRLLDHCPDPRGDPQDLHRPRGGFMVDPRLLLEPPVFVDDPRMPFEGPPPPGPLYPPMDGSLPMMHFPHLMPPHVGGPPPPMDIAHSHTIPPYDFPVLPPDPLLDFPYPPPPLDPRFDPRMNGGFMKPFDHPPPLPPPSRSRSSTAFDYPPLIEANFGYPQPMMNMGVPRETLSYDDRGIIGPPLSMGGGDPRFHGRMGWLPPSPTEARKTIQRIVRNQSYQHYKDGVSDSRERMINEAKLNKSHGEQRRRSKSTSNSDSSGRSSPRQESKSRRGSQGQRTNGFGGNPQVPNQGCTPSSFRVGEAVRKDGGGPSHREFGGKETVSLPHFVSGGKDSGFDESPVVDEPSSGNDKGNRGGTPSGGGGSFVVAGVFSDSSKMYIPAPPSPTPDYDNEHPVSDGEDSDIPQEPFYVATKAKKIGSPNEKASVCSNRDSISEDSLQECPTGSVNKGSTSSSCNPLQSMIKEFEMGLPPHKPSVKREDSRFSDDSLEEEEESSSNISPSRPSTGQRPDSMESLVSMDGSTTSFDYVTDPTQKSFSAQKSQISPNRNSPPKIKPRIPSNKNEKPEGNGSPRKKNLNVERKLSEDSKDKKANNKQSPVSSNSRESSKESLFSRQLSSGSCEESKKEVPKFDTIRHLIKEGLIEGLDDTPPDFAPPPPPPHKFGRSSSTSEERTDSGLGSTASTNNRTDESGGSDNQSEKMTSTPPKNSFTENLSLKNILNRKTPSPPPLPPPRDSSMSSSGSSNTQQHLSRNQSWLFKNRADNDHYHSNRNANKIENIALIQSKHSKNRVMKEKITHIDDLRNESNVKNDSRYRVTNDNDNLAIQYATPRDNKDNELNRNTFIENTKNLQSSNKFRDSCSSVCDDHGSLSSHNSSRSGRFFSRLTESMKSNSRSNSPIVNKNNNGKKCGTKYHADVIRAPSHTKKQAPKPPLGARPPEFRSVVDPSAIIPLTRDGSGRFRSIEDLAEIAASSGGKSLELRRGDDDIKKKKKKNSTLPPNLNSSDVLEQERDLKRNSSNMKENHHRDDADGSKFKFNIFKGFWRRNKYSLDKM